MGVRVTLDSTLLANTPMGWDKAKINSKRQQDLRVLLSTFTTDLTFWGDGFDYLDDKINEDYCNVVDVLIESDDCQEGTWVTEFNGIIQLTQISKYDVTQRTITTAILDESFDAKISNNKSIKAFIDVGESKNGENIQAATENDIGFFLPSADFGTFIATKRKGYRVYDCFRFIIDYMTDGQVGFKSDVFSGKYYHWMLFNGKEVRVGGGNGNQLEVSFKDLFKELHRKTNLSFAIEPTPSGYTDQFQLRLEETSYFENEDAILTFDNVKDILMSFNKEELYSHVEIGSKDYDNNVDLSYPPLNFKSFKEENYTILGQCNIDKALNLVSSYIIDTNVIELLLTTGSTDTKYDNKTFLVVTDGTNCIKYKEYNAPLSEGTDDAGTANRLTDSTADFNADGVATGDMAVNMLTGLSTNINSVDAGGTFCILADDIFNNGDDYQIRTAPFNYNHPLANIEVVSRFLGGLPNSVIKKFSVSATSNFRAGITSNVVDTSFPVTINPFVYDDDSTPPFFDDGANFDAVTNYDYTIPSSGLYGFEMNTILRMNGSVGNDLITNGDFSSFGTGWVTNAESNFSSNKFSLSDAQPIGAFLRQYLTLKARTVLSLNFDCTITLGNIIAYGETITTSGNYTITIDRTNETEDFPYLQFDFGSTLGNLSGAILTIDNVTLKESTTFNITQSIIRSSSAGYQLQEFSDTFNFSFPKNIFQVEDLLKTSKTFSAFTGERITSKIVITKISGNNTKTTILTDRTNFITSETEYTEFKTTLTDDGGGDILPVDPSTFPIYKYKFKKAMTLSDFKLLKDSPEKAILFSKNSTDHLFGWRNSIRYDRETGKAEFEVRSKTKINGDC